MYALLIKKVLQRQRQVSSAIDLLEAHHPGNGPTL